MPALRDVVAGPWRAVLVLGVTQILAWGALFYPPVLTLPLIAADRGWSQTFAMSGLSIALFTAGLFSPRVGKLIDRHGRFDARIDRAHAFGEWRSRQSYDLDAWIVADELDGLFAHAVRLVDYQQINSRERLALFKRLSRANLNWLVRTVHR